MTKLEIFHTKNLTRTNLFLNPETLKALSLLPKEELLIICSDPKRPVLIKQKDGKNYILDGNHRHKALEKRGGAKIEVQIANSK